MERLTKYENSQSEYIIDCKFESCDTCKENILDLCSMQDKVIQKCGEYENTGLTPQEVKDLKQKQIPKKIIRWGSRSNAGVCPNCQENISRYPYCPLCGQKLDWSVIDEM